MSLRAEDKQRIVARMAVSELGDHESIEVMFAGDYHVGDDSCDLDQIRRSVVWLNSAPNRYAYILGDMLNTATKHSVSHQHGDMSLKEARKLLVRILEPGRTKILGCIRGNHDQRVEKETGEDEGDIIATLLGIPYWGDEAFVALKFGSHYNNGSRILYVGYLTHGTSGGRRPGGTLNSLEDLSRIYAGADFYGTGHSHKPIAYPGSVFIPDRSAQNVVRQEAFYISTGASLDRTSASYAARKAYPPLAKLWPIVRFDGTRKKMTAILET